MLQTKKKNQHFKFQNWRICEINKRPRPLKSSYQIKEEQVNFLLEDIERNLEEYEKAIEIRDKQLSDAKKILKNAKTSYDSIVRKNKQLKEYNANIK